MSELNEIQGQSVNEPMDVSKAIGQLRLLVCGLGAALLIVSLMLTVFIFKQNRNLAGTITARQRQLSQLQVSNQPLDYAVNELARYSAGKPELTALLAKHGLEIAPTTGASQPKH